MAQKKKFKKAKKITKRKSSVKAVAKPARKIKTQKPPNLDAKLMRLSPQIEKQIGAIRRNLEIAGHLAGDLKMVGLRVLERARKQVVGIPGMSKKKKSE